MLSGRIDVQKYISKSVPQQPAIQKQSSSIPKPIIIEVDDSANDSNINVLRSTAITPSSIIPTQLSASTPIATISTTNIIPSSSMQQPTTTMLASQSVTAQVLLTVL